MVISLISDGRAWQLVASAVATPRTLNHVQQVIKISQALPDKRGELACVAWGCFMHQPFWSVYYTDLASQSPKKTLVHSHTPFCTRPCHWPDGMCHHALACHTVLTLQSGPYCVTIMTRNSKRAKQIVYSVALPHAHAEHTHLCASASVSKPSLLHYYSCNCKN